MVREPKIPENRYRNAFFQLTSGQSMFVGPCGFDVGYLLAEYFYTYYYHMRTPGNRSWHRKISYQMIDAANETGRVISTSFYIWGHPFMTSSQKSGFWPPPLSTWAWPPPLVDVHMPSEEMSPFLGNFSDFGYLAGKFTIFHLPKLGMLIENRKTEFRF